MNYKIKAYRIMIINILKIHPSLHLQIKTIKIMVQEIILNLIKCKVVKKVKYNNRKIINKI